MTRLIDAEALKKRIIAPRANGKDLITELIDSMPTVDAVPTEFVMENCNPEFVCYVLADDGEWCSERCQYSEPQPECIHRYIDKIWRKEHDKAD